MMIRVEKIYSQDGKVLSEAEKISKSQKNPDRILV